MQTDLSPDCERPDEAPELRTCDVCGSRLPADERCYCEPVDPLCVARWTAEKIKAARLECLPYVVTEGES